jgi:V8-like Glu-specific endopeptidase
MTLLKQRKKIRHLPLTLSVAVLSACAGEGLPPDGLDELAEQSFLLSETQCDATWEVQDVERYDGTLGVSRAFVAAHERRVGHLERGCSGTLISDDLFLSAGHCTYVVGDMVRFDYQNDAAGNPRVPVRFRVSQVVEQQDVADWDYAIVRLEGTPGREFGHASIAPVDPPANSTVAIIGHPNSIPKIVDAGPITSGSGLSSNFLRHRVDTDPGSSGSGILTPDGQLIGIHTDGGCTTTGGENKGMRLSRLIPHSATLQVLSRSRVAWRHTDGRVALWRVEANGRVSATISYGPLAGWTPVSMSGNRLLWTHTDGRASVWRLNDNGSVANTKDYGPFTGWTVVNYSDERLLWRHSNGQASLWRLDGQGNVQGSTTYGPFAGWTVLSYANNRLLWRDGTNKASFWVLGDGGNVIRSAELGPLAGWAPERFDNGELYWSSTTGKAMQWVMNRDGTAALFSNEQGPFANFQPIIARDRKFIWRHIDNHVAYWTTNWNGGALGSVDLTPGTGWAPSFTAGVTPP